MNRIQAKRQRERREDRWDGDDGEGDHPWNMTRTIADLGGEGSRGGKVIGHTGSGKPIYQSHGHPSHKDFSKQEHGEAAKKHDELSTKYEKESDRHYAADRNLKGMEHGEKSKHHYNQMVLHHKSAGSKIDPKTAKWVQGNK